MRELKGILNVVGGVGARFAESSASVVSAILPCVEQLIALPSPPIAAGCLRLTSDN